MSNVKWTPSQSDAITARDGDILVSAAAGSGKTAVLVERVIRMITDEENPVDIDKLLVVTFTNAAASQMKEKISKALSSAIEKIPCSKRLRDQLLLLQSANIYTVHSFCKNVIQNNFQKTDLPFEFDIIQDTENKLLMADALDETFNEYYESEEKCDDFSLFADSFSKNDDTSAEELVLKLYKFLRSMPFYTDWLEEKLENASFENPDTTIWWKIIKEYALTRIGCAMDMNKKALSIIADEGEALGVSAYFGGFSDDKILIEQLKSAVSEGYEKAYSFCRDLSFSRLGTKAKDADGEAVEFLKALRDSVKGIINKLKKEVFFQSVEEIKIMSKGCARELSVLSDVVKTFDEKYSLKKKQRGAVDFSDLEHICLSLLAERQGEETVPTDIALNLRESFSEVMVDEYQDTNNIQETIISMVSGEGKRFMVGDIKQSIYRFRNSNPELFLEKYNKYPADAGFGSRKILLSQNFRSAENIIDFVNFIFGNIMCKSCGSLDYTEDEKLYFGELYQKNDNSADIYVLDKKAESFDSEMTAYEREAYLCASKIREMVACGFEVEDKGVIRKCRYSDFMLLLRSDGVTASDYRAAFSDFNIPVYIEKGEGYFETPGIKLAVSILKIIDNPLQDIHIVSVLRSHIFGFSEDRLVDIRLKSPEEKFCACLKMAQEAGEGDVCGFYERLDKWRNFAKIESVHNLIEYLMEDCFMYSAFPADGDKFRMLIDWGKKYESTSFKGLFRFITYLQKQIEEGENIGTSQNTAGDFVTMMSIHKSKGLESNIVILSGCGKGFNLMDGRERMIFDDYLGIAADYADTQHRIMYKTFSKTASKIKYESDCVSEEMRLLYVALTRAKQKLIIIGSYNDYDKKWAELKSIALCKNKKGYSEASALEASCYLDWIISAMAFYTGEEKFKVNVTINPEISVPYVTEKTEKKIRSDKNFDEAKKILEYEYPYLYASKIPSKLSVSEIKTRFYAQEADDEVVYFPKEIQNTVQLIPRPAFLRGEGKITASMLGTVYHSVLQHLDFNRVTEENLSASIDMMKIRKIITENEQKALDEELIKAFIKSPLFNEIKNADKVYKELSFIIPFNSSKLFGGEGEDIMVQGIIDCLYVKDGKYHVVDYKSDSYSAKSEMIDRYKTQLYVYSEAVEKKFGEKPVSCGLYMLRGKEYLSV